MDIQFQDLALSFRTKTQTIHLFEHLNVSFEKGSYTVVYGASGKGKSTLLNLISGFVIPQQGCVLVDGKNLCKLSEKQKCRYRNQKIGYMFQNFNLIQQLNVRDNVAVPLLLGGMSRKKAYERVEELLDGVHLSSHRYEYPRTLSGGEQQRIAFARAIANRPEMILADEPIANLDQENAGILLQYFDTLWKQGVTFVCVSHNECMRREEYRLINIEEITKVR